MHGEGTVSEMAVDHKQKKWMKRLEGERKGEKQIHGAQKWLWGVWGKFEGLEL